MKQHWMKYRFAQADLTHSCTLGYGKTFNYRSSFKRKFYLSNPMTSFITQWCISSHIVYLKNFLPRPFPQQEVFQCPSVSSHVKYGCKHPYFIQYCFMCLWLIEINMWNITVHNTLLNFCLLLYFVHFMWGGVLSS